MRLYFSNILFIVVSLCLEFIQASDPDNPNSPIVKTDQGLLEGVTLKSRDGKPYHVFRGIPYGEFPGRFEVATLHPSWDGIRSAKNFGSVCAQIDLLKVDQNYTGDERCLFLNVYTPTLDANAHLPVMVWIHGGGFGMGSGDGYDGKYFADENVIVVSINYRLGPLGFLSFEEENGYANGGLKDQRLALQWVLKNIQAFGGDSSKVTIAGQSAGGAATHMHILSERSSALFRAAISHSGTALSFWAVQENARENAIKLAKVLECPVPETPDSTFQKTWSCLKSKSAKEVTVAQLKLKKWQIYPVVLFGPVIEPKGENSFLTEKPDITLKTGRFNKVNWITGITEDDGSIFDIPLMLNATITETLENEWEDKAPIIMGFENLPKSQQELISTKIRDHYFGHYEIEEMTWSSLRKMLTDRYFLEPLVHSIELQSQHSQGHVYPYVFKFSGDFSVVHPLFNLEGDHGIAHGDELQYLFPGGGGAGAPDYSGETPVEIVEFSRKIVKLWANFVETTVPVVTLGENIEWQSYSSNPKSHPFIPFYEISIKPEIWDEDLSTRLKVWTEVFPKKTETFVKSEL